VAQKKPRRTNLFKCGEIVIRETQQERSSLPGRTVSGANTSGDHFLYEVMDGKGMAIEVVYVKWENGEEDVRATKVVGGSRALRRLEPSRLRMGIYEFNNEVWWVELSQAQIKREDPNRWSTRRLATLDQLNAGAGIDLESKLAEVGSIDVGPKALVINDLGRRRNYYCAIFPAGNMTCPVAAFVLTRILPLYHGYMG